MTGERGGLWRKIRSIVGEFAGSGPLHRRRLSNIGIRISVSGVRGKSTAVRWLHEVLHGRGYDTYAKVTGVRPLSIYNGTEHEIDRPAKVRLYENERQLRRFAPVDAAVVENQGIREYTTRLVNAQFVRPHVVFLTNVREDHLDTLGRTRIQIAQSLARSVPAGTHVVSGEQDDRIRNYLEAELDRRDATVTHVQLPEESADLPGAELVYGLNPVLETVGEEPLTETEIASLRNRLEIEWTHVPEGRVYNAAPANDVQSTELIRRYLTADPTSVVQPLLYLRTDRRGRTAAFVRYFQTLYDIGAIEQARVIGREADLFKRRVSVPVVTHEEDTEDPRAVLDDALEDGWPVVLMGNTVSEFMRELTASIEADSQKPTKPGPVS